MSEQAKAKVVDIGLPNGHLCTEGAPFAVAEVLAPPVPSAVGRERDELPRVQPERDR